MPSYARDTQSSGASTVRRATVEQGLEVGIGVVRVVVEQHQAAHPRPLRELERMADRAVAPTDVIRILLVEVLRVVEQHVDVAHDVVAAHPMVGLRGEAPSERRLVVGEIGKRPAAFLDAVSDRRALVGHAAGSNHRRADRDAVLVGVVEGDARRDVREPHGEERRRQVDRDALGQRLHRRRRPPDVHVGSGPEQRLEEAQPLQVVQVQMREEDVDLGPRGRRERGAERAHAGAGIEHEDMPALEAHLDARGVPAVANRGLAGRGERAATAPDPGEHQPEPSGVAASQNTATTPCNSSCAPNSG